MESSEDEYEEEEKTLAPEDITQFKKKNRIEGVDFKQRIIILPGKDPSVLKDCIITSLPHPKRGLNARFAINKNQVCELNRVTNDPSSWFINQNVERDGSIYLATPIDPIFLLIRLLEQNRKKTEESEGYFCDISQMLTDAKQPGFFHLLPIVETIDLCLICDVNKEHSPTLYRLNDDKVLRWLRCKVDNLIPILETNVQSNSVSSSAPTFRRSEKSLKKPNSEEVLKSSLGFISEYIDSFRMDSLSKSYGLTHFGVPKLTAFDEMAVYSHKRSNPDNEPEKERKEPAKKPRLTPGQAKLAKTDVRGIPKISTFFTKK